jgi:hypothetical protein
VATAKPVTTTSDLVAPIDEGKNQPAEVGEKLPERAPQATRPLAPAVTKTKPTRRLRPGDLICGQCGEGNPPVRKFCSRCGNSLLEAQHVKEPWWRRLIKPFRRGPRVVEVPDSDEAAEAGPASAGRHAAAHAAGVRKSLAAHDPKHMMRKVYRRARLALGAVVVVAIILFGAFQPFRSLVFNKFDSVKSKIIGAVDIKYDPVHPISATANLQYKEYPGSNAVDSFLNTYWMAPYSTSDYPTLTLTFANPVTLERMIIYSGVSNNYLAYGRPSLLVLVFSNNKSATITPQDTPKEQTLDISNAVQVTSVKIEVEGTYPGTGSGRSKVAISDIELFELS